MSKSEVYFWCESGEDGTSIRPMTKEQVEKQIAENISEDINPEYHYKFLDKIPDSDSGCWIADEHAVLIIKGEILVPKPIQTVVKMVVD